MTVCSLCCAVFAAAVIATSIASSSTVVTSLSPPQETASDVIATTVLSSTASSTVTMTTQQLQPEPVATTTDEMVNDGGATDSEIMSRLSGLLSMLPTKPSLHPTVSVFQSDAPAVPSPPPPITASNSGSFDQPPVSDGSTTPVGDEPVEKRRRSPTPEPRVDDEQSAAEQPPTTKVVDPIALLNQMLSRSRPASTTTSSSVNFLQSLTMLTKTVPSSGPAASVPDDDEVYMGSYGRLDDRGVFAATTTWSDRSDAETGPPIKPLDHETPRTSAVSIPISLATQSMGPPPLQSIYSTLGISGVCGGSSDQVTTAPFSVMTATSATSDRGLSSELVNDRFPARIPENFDAVNAHVGSLPAQFGSRLSQETYPLPGLDVEPIQDFERRGGPLSSERSSAAGPFPFRSPEPAAPRDVLPVDEFTERLRRKTSMAVSDGIAAPPFPDIHHGIAPAVSQDRFDEGLRPPPPFDPPSNSSSATRQPAVYQDRTEVEPEYGERYDKWEFVDRVREEPPPMVSTVRPVVPVIQNPFPPRGLPGSPPMMFPRPDFYQEPHGPEEFRPRFISRLPPPAAFSSLRPPPPPPERFLRPFFPRF